MILTIVFLLITLIYPLYVEYNREIIITFDSTFFASTLTPIVAVTAIPMGITSLVNNKYQTNNHLKIIFALLLTSLLTALSHKLLINNVTAEIIFYLACFYFLLFSNLIIILYSYNPEKISNLKQFFFKHKNNKCN